MDLAEDLWIQANKEIWKIILPSQSVPISFRSWDPRVAAIMQEVGWYNSLALQALAAAYRMCTTTTPSSSAKLQLKILTSTISEAPPTLKEARMSSSSWKTTKPSTCRSLEPSAYQRPEDLKGTAERTGLKTDKK
jgi:hypothetical protein